MYLPWLEKLLKACSYICCRMHVRDKSKLKRKILQGDFILKIHVSGYQGFLGHLPFLVFYFYNVYGRRENLT